MLKFIQSLFLVLTFIAIEAHAARSSLSTMSPRTMWQEEKDTSYGFSILPGQSIDSLEGLNRKFFFLNYNILDSYLLRPVAVGYSYLPDFVQTSTGNFFSNIDDLNSTVNNLILLRFSDSNNSLWRFLINSTLGLAGFIDVATLMHIDKKEMSFNTALGVMGMSSGAYVNVPFTGPNTARSLQANAVDDAPFLFFPNIAALALYVVEGVHERSLLLDQDGLIANALDPYAQMRDTYLMYQDGKLKKAKGIEEEELVQDEDIDDSLLDELD